MLTAVDCYTRECLAIDVGQSLKGALSGPPAWQRTLALYAERIGVSVDDLRSPIHLIL